MNIPCAWHPGSCSCKTALRCESTFCTAKEFETPRQLEGAGLEFLRPRVACPERPEQAKDGC